MQYSDAERVSSKGKPSRRSTYPVFGNEASTGKDVQTLRNSSLENQMLQVRPTGLPVAERSSQSTNPRRRFTISLHPLSSLLNPTSTAGLEKDALQEKIEQDIKDRAKNFQEQNFSKDDIRKGAYELLEDNSGAKEYNQVFQAFNELHPKMTVEDKLDTASVISLAFTKISRNDRLLEEYQCRSLQGFFHSQDNLPDLACSAYILSLESEEPKDISSEILEKAMDFSEKITTEEYQVYNFANLAERYAGVDSPDVRHLAKVEELARKVKGKSSFHYDKAVAAQAFLLTRLCNNDRKLQENLRRVEEGGSLYDMPTAKSDEPVHLFSFAESAIKQAHDERAFPSMHDALQVVERAEKNIRSMQRGDRRESALENVRRAKADWRSKDVGLPPEKSMDDASSGKAMEPVQMEISMPSSGATKSSTENDQQVKPSMVSQLWGNLMKLKAHGQGDRLAEETTNEDHEGYVSFGELFHLGPPEHDTKPDNSKALAR